MKINFLWLAILSLLIACHPRSQENVQDARQYRPSYMHDLLGTYTGTLPCADCEGIRYTLTLNDDSRFETSVIYLGKSDKILSAQGAWSIKNDSIVFLNRPDSSQSQFLIGKNTLLMLDVSGKKIEGALADQYILERSSPAEEDTEAFARKQEQGIDFMAMGNEPFWSLDIDFEKSMVFKTPNADDSVLIPVPQAQREKENPALVYDTTTNAGNLKVQILEKPCADNMSGALFEYTVQVNMHGKEYMGCGKYLNLAYLINDIWILEKLAGDPVEAGDFQKDLPSLQINVTHQNFTGHTGCNNIRGKTEVKEEKIRFKEPFTMTRMSCPGGFEQKYLDKLKKVNNYAIADKKLILYVDNNAAMVFRKAVDA